MSCRSHPTFIVDLSKSVGSNDERRDSLHPDIHSTGRAVCMEHDLEEQVVQEICEQGLEATSGVAKSLSASRKSLKDGNRINRSDEKNDTATIEGNWQEYEQPEYLHMLPPEIWKKIIGMVDDSKDLENLYHSSPVFRDLMQTDRVNFMGPQVIKILKARGYIESGTRNVPWKPNADLPFSFDVRLVCKSWDKAVETYFEERYHQPRLQFTSKFGKKRGFYSGMPSQPSMIQRRSHLEFWNSFNSTHANADRSPYIGKAETVAILPDTLDIFLDILRLYGKYLWGLKCDIYGLFQVNILYQYLAATPNLRRFEISNFRGYAEILADLIPPVLPNLVTLKAPLDVALTSGLLKSNPSIENLQLAIRIVPEVRSLNFPNVKLLKLVLHRKVGLIPFQTTALRMLTIHWKHLRGLHFYEPSENEDSITFLHDFFRTMNENWGKAELLKEIELELPVFNFLLDICTILTNAGSLRLDLRKVEKVRLLMFNPYMIDFLLPMKKMLKYLRIKIQYYDIKDVICKTSRHEEFSKSFAAAKNAQDIHFLGFERKMLKSNIWDKFPHLDEVVLEGQLGYETDDYYPLNGVENEKVHYTRKQWEQANTQVGESLGCKNKLGVRALQF